MVRKRGKEVHTGVSLGKLKKKLPDLGVDGKCIIYYAPSIHNVHQTRYNNYNKVIFGYLFRP